jgi:hypothetical protein
MRAPRLTALVVALAPALALAGDGRIEINQAEILATGGFPYTISQPGNYVLTSDLNVPAGSDGLQFLGNDFALDLNGFRIDGNATCLPSNCVAGTARGVYHFPSVALGRRISVRNGTIQGFTGNCLSLALDAFVKDLRVTQCGGRGIEVSSQSLVVGNRVSNTGGAGIAMLGAPSAFGGNIVTDAGLATTARAVQGGLATTGNVCDDGSCGNAARRFYLTTTSFLGADADAPGSCAPGFHFASRWELLDSGALSYDPALGWTTQDSGSGPPMAGGWIRMATDDDEQPCGTFGSPWSVNASTGTTASLSEGGTPWVFSFSNPCGNPRPVWCIQD